MQVPAARPGEEELDRSLRPQALDDFVGQEQVKRQLALFIEAARRRGEALDHVLLAGPPGPRQDLARAHRRARAGRPAGPDRRAGAGAQGRRGRVPDRARARLGVLHRRDPPPHPRGRGDALPGDGGPPPADRARAGRGRAHRDARPAAVHADRRDHAHGTADDAAARALRRRPPARALPARGPRADRAPLGGHPRGGDRRRGRARDRGPGARHSPGREPAAAAGARLRAGARQRDRDDARSQPRRSRCSRSTRPGSSASTASC